MYLFKLEWDKWIKRKETVCYSLGFLLTGIAFSLLLLTDPVTAGMTGRKSVQAAASLLAGFQLLFLTLCLYPVIGDFYSGFIKDAVGYGTGRVRIYLSKTVIVLIQYAGSQILLAGGIVVFFTVKNGFGTALSGEGREYIFRVLGMYTVYLVSVGMIGIFLAFAARDFIPVVIAAIVYPFTTAMLEQYVKPAGKVMEKVLITQRYQDICRPDITGRETGAFLLLAAGTAAVFFFGGMWYFQRAEIK